MTTDAPTISIRKATHWGQDRYYVCAEHSSPETVAQIRILTHRITVTSAQVSAIEKLCVGSTVRFCDCTK